MVNGTEGEFLFLSGPFVSALLASMRVTTWPLLRDSMVSVAVSPAVSLSTDDSLLLSMTLHLSASLWLASLPDDTVILMWLESTETIFPLGESASRKAERVT